MYCTYRRYLTGEARTLADGGAPPEAPPLVTTADLSSEALVLSGDLRLTPPL